MVFSVLTRAEDTIAFSCNDTLAPPPRHIFSVGGSGAINHLLNIKVRGEKLVKRGWGSNYNIFFNGQANPADTAINIYDRVFGFPTLEAGLLLSDFSHTRLRTGDAPYYSTVGMVWAAYIGFRRDVYRNRKWAFGYGLCNGLSLSSRTYEKNNNIDDDLIGQHLSVYFGCDLFASYRIAPEIEIGAAFEYKHFSNGATDRPNKGANSYGLALRARCDLNRPEYDKGLTYSQRLARLQSFRREKFDDYFYLDVNAACGFRTLYEEWLYRREEATPDDSKYLDGKFALHTVWSTDVVPMYRYNQVHASGIGLEYTFAGYTSRAKMVNEQVRGIHGYTYSKHILAIAAHHEVFYKQLSLAMSVGTYLFKKTGPVGKTYEVPVYETVGLRYYPKFFQPFYLGYNVKANLGKAYDMEVKIGMHIGKWGKQK